MAPRAGGRADSTGVARAGGGAAGCAVAGREGGGVAGASGGSAGLGARSAARVGRAGGGTVVPFNGGGSTRRVAGCSMGLGCGSIGLPVATSRVGAGGSAPGAVTGGGASTGGAGSDPEAGSPAGRDARLAGPLRSSWSTHPTAAASSTRAARARAAAPRPNRGALWSRTPIASARTTTGGCGGSDAGLSRRISSSSPGDSGRRSPG
jgi:hypothetical protein